jgi:hypothetical protein
MLETSQVSNKHYHSNELSLKRQTIREDGTQNHGSLQVLLSTAKTAGLPAPKEES